MEDALNFTDSGLKFQAKTYVEARTSDDQTNQNKSGRLGRLLQKLSEKDIAGKEHIEEYLRDQHRRNRKVERDYYKAIRKINHLILFINNLKTLLQLLVCPNRKHRPTSLEIVAMFDSI